MLGALLLTGLVAAAISSIAMFVPLRSPWRVAGAWAFLRRLSSALVATCALGVIAIGVSLWAGTRPFDAVVSAISFVVFSALWIPVTRRWNGRAHACWTACMFLYAAYLAFIVDWTLHSNLGVGGTVGGVLLWALEVVAGLFAAAYLWELCDALGTEHWRRRVRQPRPAISPADYQPFVSLHVPAHNEPSDMVIQTLSTLCQLDYPNYEIIAIDDNTEDPDLWEPVQAWCESHGVKFVHLSDWPGYKSGALNYALHHLTDERAELIGVVDSDYQIAPWFLRSCAPLFADPNVGFIQAPQDYRDWSQSPYYRRLYYSYRYFFAVSQPSRNERDAAIFAGTMGLIRRRALLELGGWDEWCITEDAELSLRVLRAGWSGLHVDQSFGQGVMPLTFEALKSQRYRWCFGGIQILRMYWRSLLPGRVRRTNNLTLGQRWGYLAGGLQWYGDLLGVLFYLFLLAGAVNLASGGGQLFRKLSAFLVAVVPLLVILGLVRAIALLRRGTGASWRDAFGAFFVWQSTSLVVARASIQGLFARNAVFMRTPKTFDEAGWWQVIRANWAESGLAALGAAGIGVGLWNGTTFSGALLAALLVIPTAGFAAAPWNSLAAQRAALPADLTRRRRTEFLRQPAVVRGTLAGATAVIGVGAAVVLALMLAPTHGELHTPRLVNPAPSHPGSTHPSAGTAPSSSGGSAPSSGGSAATGGGSTAPSGTSSGTVTPSGIVPGGTSSPARGGPSSSPATSGSRAPGSSTAPGSTTSPPAGAPKPAPKPTPTPQPKSTPSPTPTPTPTPTGSGSGSS
jgi:cellulose synthase/poly-beta-1,6-N-acetylglucosamine synthase-like glycosyltransferase